MARSRFFDRSDVPLEVVILLLAGIALLITGILLFPVYAGTLPYYENGLYGLLLFIFALHAVAVLLALLHLGVKGIRLGPTLPAFVSPNVLKVLVENFDIKPITDVEADVEAMMAGR